MNMLGYFIGNDGSEIYMGRKPVSKLTNKQNRLRTVLSDVKTVPVAPGIASVVNYPAGIAEAAAELSKTEPLCAMANAASGIVDASSVRKFKDLYVPDLELPPTIIAKEVGYGSPINTKGSHPLSTADGTMEKVERDGRAVSSKPCGPIIYV